MPKPTTVMRRRFSSLYLAGLLSLGACDKAGAAPTSDAAPQPATDAKAASVFRVFAQSPKAIQFDQEIVLPASVEGMESASLYSQVTGYLESIEVDIGDEVEEGAELAKLRVPEVEAKLKRAYASVEARGADIDKCQAELELAQLMLTRKTALRSKNSGATTQHAVDTAAAGVKIAEAELARARAEKAQAIGELGELKTLKRFSTIRAPFAGRIAHRYLHPGSLVREGSSSRAEPVLDIVRVSPLRLVFYVPESMTPYVAIGQEVGFNLDAFPGKEMQGKIVRVAAALDPKTRSTRMELELANSGGELRPGMFANIKLAATTVSEALELPSKALRGRGSERFVYVVAGGTLERVDITVINDDGKRAVLLAGGKGGLSADAQIMVSGPPLAQAGSAVEIVEAKK